MSMFYNQTSPWILKALVVGVYLATRGPGRIDMVTVMEQAAIPAILQTAMLAPSVFLPVRDRRRTTVLVSETAVVFCLMCLVLWAGQTSRLLPMEAATTLQMSSLHVFYLQSRELFRGTRLLVWEGLWAWVAILCSVVLPMWMVLHTPGTMPGTKSMLMVLFCGEILGTVASLSATILTSLGDAYAGSMASH